MKNKSASVDSLSPPAAGKCDCFSVFPAEMKNKSASLDSLSPPAAGKCDYFSDFPAEMKSKSASVDPLSPPAAGKCDYFSVFPAEMKNKSVSVEPLSPPAAGKCDYFSVFPAEMKNKPVSVEPLSPPAAGKCDYFSDFPAEMKNKPLLCVVGPTASGKSALSLCLAEMLNGEIISADSMQVYRGCDIGTAKLSIAERRGIPHHLLDVADPREAFSAARWTELAAEAISDIRGRNRLPIIAGGTGLYVDSLLLGRDFAESGDGALREKLNSEYDSIGGEAFRQRLAEVDPERAEKLPPADKKRLVRAMEVYMLTGETITEHDRRTRLLPPRYESVRIATGFTDRAALYARIDARVMEMVENGLFEETEALLRSGVDSTCTAMQALGYKEAAAAINGEYSREYAIELISQQTRRFAKRQLTWFRRDTGLHWLMMDEYKTVEEAAKKAVEIYKTTTAVN